MKEAIPLGHPDGRRLLHLWIMALLHPSQAFEELKQTPAPSSGLYATPVVLGITHLAIDGWVIVWLAKGFKQLFDVPIQWGTGLALLATTINVPLAMLFLRG